MKTGKKICQFSLFQNPLQYKRERQTNLILRVFGLSGESVPHEILALKSDRLADLLNIIKLQFMEISENGMFCR